MEPKKQAALDTHPDVVAAMAEGYSLVARMERIMATKAIENGSERRAFPRSPALRRAGGTSPRPSRTGQGTFPRPLTATITATEIKETG